MQNIKRTWREAATLMVLAREANQTKLFDYKVNFLDVPNVQKNIIHFFRRYWFSRELKRRVSCPTASVFQVF
jgi:hypothetical protein